MKSLMQMLVEAGYPESEIYHYRSDLYVFAIPLTRRVIEAWADQNGYVLNDMVSRFKDNITGRRMYNVPFQYLPFWAEQNKEAQ